VECSATGTTANSIWSGRQNGCFFDPPGRLPVYLLNCGSVLICRLDYVILGHVSPTGVTLKALELAPHVTFVCSNLVPSLCRLPSQNRAKISVARGEEPLDLGKGHQLQFIPIPTPLARRALYLRSSNSFTDKLFGAHVCSEQVFDEAWKLLDERPTVLL